MSSTHIERHRIWGLPLSVTAPVLVLSALAACAVLGFSLKGFMAQQRLLSRLEDGNAESRGISPNFRDASDFLTSQARMFSLRGERKYLNGYFEEANITKRREKCIDMVSDCHGDCVLDFDASRGKLRAAFTWSTRLMKIEFAAMRLAAAGFGHPESELPPEVRTAELSPEDAALPPEGKISRARELLSDTVYLKHKNEIYKNIDEFATLVVRHEHEEVHAARARLEGYARNLFLSLAVVTVVLLLIAGVMVFGELLPLRLAIKNIRRGLALAPRGMAEMRTLADAYNRAFAENARSREAETTARARAEETANAMRAAHEAANRANAAKAEFLSKISNDIRIPMNGIIGMTVIAEKHLNDPRRVADCLGKITRESRHLLTLVNGLLDISRLESGRIELVEENFSLPSLMDGLLALARPLAAEKKQKLAVNVFEVEHENVFGDSSRLSTVWQNLVTNAIKFTPEGGKITISFCEKHERNGIGCYEFSVSDNGCGMTAEFLNHVFEPFARENSPRAADDLGMGLGLAITQNIVQMMGGRIKAESEPGRGSRFTALVYFKLQRPEAEDNAILEGLPVLVVTADKDAGDAWSVMLEELGMAPARAVSPGEALAQISRCPDGKEFFAMLVDRGSPENDGLAWMRQILGEADGRAPLAVLAAYDADACESEARQAGAVAVLRKPVFKSRLAAILRQQAAGRKAETAPAAPVDEFEPGRFIGRRALLAEDEEINAEIARVILETSGLDVVQVDNGRQAVEKFAKSPAGHFDVIFMDVDMPQMNGYQATREIRESGHPDALTVPIIAMTAKTLASDVEDSKASGMNDHIAKPVDLNCLHSLMRHWLGTKTAGDV